VEPKFWSGSQEAPDSLETIVSWKLSCPLEMKDREVGLGVGVGVALQLPAGCERSGAAVPADAGVPFGCEGRALDPQLAVDLLVELVADQEVADHGGADDGDRDREGGQKGEALLQAQPVQHTLGPQPATVHGFPAAAGSAALSARST
jgi:hypothetical protein